MRKLPEVPEDSILVYCVPIWSFGVIVYLKESWSQKITFKLGKTDYCQIKSNIRY